MVQERSTRGENKLIDCIPLPEKNKIEWESAASSSVSSQNAVATKFRKGSCENCGAMTHKKKDCLEVKLVEYFPFTSTLL